MKNKLVKKYAYLVLRFAIFCLMFVITSLLGLHFIQIGHSVVGCMAIFTGGAITLGAIQNLLELEHGAL